MWMRLARVLPGQVLLVSSDRGLRLVRRGRTLVWPGEKVQEVSLAPVTVRFNVPALPSGGKTVTVRGEAQVLVDSTTVAALTWAALQALGRGPDEMMERGLGVLERHLRAQVCGRTPGSADRDQLAARVREAASPELTSMGLCLGSLDIGEVHLTAAGPDGDVDDDVQPPLATLVTTRNPHVLKELGARGFERLHLAHLVAHSGAEALELVRRYRPAAALIDFELPDMPGHRVCQAIKATARTSQTRVVLLVNRALTRVQLRRIEASGCDDLLCLPAPGGELREHLACLVGAPFRRSRRTRVGLSVIVETAGHSVGAPSSICPTTAAGSKSKPPSRWERTSSSGRRARWAQRWCTAR